MYHELGTQNFNCIILITSSSDPKISSLTRDGFITFTLNGADEHNLSHEDQRKIVKIVLNISDENVIDSVIELFSCNLHILSDYK